MSALVGVHAEAWGMPNHCQHVLVDGDLSAAYVPPVREGAGRVSGSSRCSPVRVGRRRLRVRVAPWPNG
jgi:hypothetical protein